MIQYGCHVYELTAFSFSLFLLFFFCLLYFYPYNCVCAFLYYHNLVNKDLHCVSKKYTTQPPTIILAVVVLFQ